MHALSFSFEPRRLRNSLTLNVEFDAPLDCDALLDRDVLLDWDELLDCDVLLACDDGALACDADVLPAATVPAARATAKALRRSKIILAMMSRR